MSETQRGTLDRALRRKLSELEQSVDTGRDGLPAVEHARLELERGAHDLQQRDGDFEVEAGMLDHDDTEIADVRNALQRVHGSAYGHCVDCNAQIPFDRLMAEPETRYCLACAAHGTPGPEGSAPAS